MTLDIQFKLKNNPIYQRYICEHSIWYKILTRDPSSFKRFEDNVKSDYKLRTTDKMERVFNTIEMFQTILNSMK